MFKLNKSKRYAIHYSIVTLICLIPCIWSFDTAYKLYKKELPRYNYEIVANGVIQNKLTSGSDDFFIINDKKFIVTTETYNRNSVGDSVELSKKYESGWSGIRIIFSALVWVCIVIFLFRLTVQLIQFYFKWLKGE